MKKVKIQDDPKFAVIGFYTYGASYGKIIYTDRMKLKYDKKDKYLVEFNLNMIGKSFYIYRGEKKPKFKNLNILTAIWTPVIALSYILFLLVAIYLIFTFFFKKCLFEEGFITDRLGMISGYISLLFSIIGLFSTVYFLINIIN